MKIHFVYPNFKSANAGGRQEPLGMLSLATVLQQAGHSLSFTDMTFARSLSVIDDAAKKADILGIGCTTPLFGKALEILKYTKKIKPSLFTIAGGPHATQNPRDALKKGFDLVVIGEAEISLVTLLSILEQGGNWKKTPGIAYIEGDKLILNPRAKFIENLDSLPLVNRDLIDQKRYLRKNDYVSLHNSRGCPFNCLFCKPMQDQLFGTRIRTRSAQSVAEEIEMLYKEYGARRFRFNDDTLLFCGQPWFEELKKEFARRNLNKIKWYCNARVDQVNEPLLKFLKIMGLEAIAFGVESGSQKILDFYRKGTSLEQIKQAFLACHKLNIITHAFIMLGAPDETKEDLEKTLALFKELNPYSCRLFITTPFPGNFLHKYAEENGLCLFNGYEDYDNALNLIKKKLPMKLKHLKLQDILIYSKKIKIAYFLGNIARCITDWTNIRFFLTHMRAASGLLLSRR